MLSSLISLFQSIFEDLGHLLVLLFGALGFDTGLFVLLIGKVSLNLFFVGVPHAKVALVVHESSLLFGVF